MGTTGSKLEKSLPSSFPDNERIFGLENFGNTCYCNSVLQALYFCLPFREAVLDWARACVNSKVRNDEDSMLVSVAETFLHISSNKKKFGVYGPKKLIQVLRKNNEAFRGYQHQDAHEFMNYLLNQITEELHMEAKELAPHSVDRLTRTRVLLVLTSGEALRRCPKLGCRISSKEL
mmetsp:Transcript_47812/g.149906  ORF Transcript_47812/g.149906 Transcript_47812/m.149906 type:complete len:176 (-) Transcript_47812:629-1156(-)